MEATQEDNGVVELDLRTELGNEILARSEGDILNQNNLSALSLAMGEYRIKTDDELLAEKLARQTFGTDINFAWDKHLASFSNTTYLLKQQLDTTALMLEDKYQSLDQRVQKYENMLYDITMDSANFTMDRTDIEFSGWTILAQAAAWDNEILKKLSNFKAEIDQSIQDSIDNGLDDVLSNVPDLEEWINDAIEALGNSPIISDLYDLLTQADGKVDHVKDDFFQSLGALRTEALGELITLRNNVEKELRDYTDNLALEVEARHAALDTLTTALQTEIDDRIEAMESIAGGMQVDIAERLAKIDELEDGLTLERIERTEAHDKLIQDITTYKSSTDNSLAVLQTDVKAHATELEAITEEVKLLHASVGEFDSSILEEYATKADLNSTEASISKLMESKLNDSSNALSQKIDETKTSITKDLDGKITAQTKVTDGLKSTIDGNQAAIVNNYLTKVDTNKAITEAVNTAKSTLNTAIANEAGRIDKVTTSVSKVGDDLVALSEDVKTLNALVDDAQATLTENYYTKAKTDEAISGKVTQYVAKLSTQSKKATLVFTTETLPTLVTNAPNTPVAVSIDSTAKAGSIITFGTGTGASEAIYTLAPEEAILIDPDKLYVLRYRFKRVSGTGGVYVGLSCLNESRTKNINRSNAELGLTTFSLSHHAVSNSKSTLDEWITGEYYFKGRVESGASTGSGTKANPRKLAANAVYARPIFWSSYQTQDTVTVCDYVELECLDIDTDEYATAKALTETKAEVIKNADDQIKAVSGILDSLSGTVGDNQAKLINNYSTTVDMNKAISNATTSLSTRMDGINTGSTNLINRWTLRTGYIAANTGGISSNGGNEPTATSTFVTDEAYYPCKAGQVYYITKHEETTTPAGEWSRFAWYNSSKELISYTTPYYSNTKVGASTKMTAPANAAFFRYTLLNPRDRVKLELGGVTEWTAGDEATWSESNVAKKGTLLSDAIDSLKVDITKNAEGIIANANKTTLLEVKGSGDHVTNLLKDPTFLNVANTWEGSLLNLFARKLPTEDLLAKASSAYPATIKAIDLTGTSLEYYGALTHELIPITPGRKYSISGGIRCIPEASSEGSVRISVDLTDASGTIVKWQDLFTLSLDTTEAYTPFSESFTVEEGELFARVRCRLRYSKDGKLKTSLVALPNLSLEVEPVSLSKAMSVLDAKYEDVAGVQKSQSSQITSLESNLEGSSANYIVNDEASLTGTNFISRGSLVDLAVEGVGTGVGNKSSIAAGSSIIYMDFVVAPKYRYGTSATRMKVVAGRTYLVECEVMSTVARTCLIYFNRYDASGSSISTKAPTTLGNQIYTKAMTPNEWVKLSGTFLAEEGSVQAIARLRNNANSSTAGITYIRNVKVTMLTSAEDANATYVAGIKTEVQKDYDDKIKVVTDSTTVLKGVVDGHTSAISTQAKITDGLKAQYLVKMETNGVLAGFGLLQDTNVLGQVVSAFGVNADSFYIGAPATGKKPFIVTTKTTTIDGVSYPAGTWIDVAFIAKATIGTAHIADASITNAKIKDINADKITAGTIDAARIRVGSSTTFDTGYNPATNLTTATNLANTKSKTFTSTPTVPYSIGDIWKDGVTIKISTVARASTATYTAGDWVLVGDITANGTSADTAKVNGVAASTVTANASKGLAVYDDVMSDLKITPVEKTAINQEWKRIQAEYATLISQANALSVSTTNYVSAYNGLGTTAPSMTTILSSLTTTTTLTSAQRDAYRTQYTNYYTQVSALTKAIDDKIAADAQAALDGLAIGGRNYVLDSSTVTKNKTLSPSWDFTALSGQDVTISFDIEVTTATTGTLTVGSAVRDRIGVEVGVTQASGGTLYFSAFCYEVLSKGVFKERVVKRIRLPELTTNPKTLNYLPQVTGGTFLVSNLKIELGTKDTDWTPAAEDLAKTFMSTPTVPYSLGDMWRNGSALYVCTTAQTSSGTYNVSNWTLVGDVTANNTAADSLKLGGTLADTVIKNASTGSSMAADILSDLVVTPVEKTALYNEYNRIKAEYTNQLAQANALSVTTTSYTTAYNAIDGTAPKMSTILSSMTASTTLTTTERNNFRTQLNTYYTQATAIAKSITTAVMAKAAADTAAVSKEVATALTTLDNIASDTIITPVEKKQVKTIWDSISVGNTNLLAQATKAGVSSSAYTTAYNTLNTYVTALLKDMNANSTVVRNTFNTNFSNVYTQIAALEKLINDAAFVGTEKVNSITSVVSNETVIEGGKIRTGTIEADRLSTTALNTISLQARNGTFTGTDGSKTVINGGLTTMYYSNGNLAIRLGVE